MKAFLFLFGGVGVINGLLYSLYAFVNNNKSKSGMLFGALVAMLSVRIGKSIYYHFIEDSDRLVRQIGLSACILIGPLFFLYVYSIMKPKECWKNWEIFLIGFFSLSIMVIGLIYPYSNFPEIWNGWIIHYIYGTWFVFLTAGIAMQYSLWVKAFKENVSKEERRVLLVSVAMIFISASYFFALYIDGITYLWASLIFTAVFYYLVYSEIQNKFSFVAARKELLPLSRQQALLKQLHEVVDKNNLYQNPKFNLKDLAKAASLPKNLVSRVLNEGYKNGYTRFINEKRVEKAKELIAINDHLSLEGIGKESGFNSKSSFYSVFKKLTNRTPASFKKSMQDSNSSIK